MKIKDLGEKVEIALSYKEAEQLFLLMEDCDGLFLGEKCPREKLRLILLRKLDRYLNE